MAALSPALRARSASISRLSASMLVIGLSSTMSARCAQWLRKARDRADLHPWATFPIPFRKQRRSRATTAQAVGWGRRPVHAPRSPVGPRAPPRRPSAWGSGKFPCGRNDAVLRASQRDCSPRLQVETARRRSTQNRPGRRESYGNGERIGILQMEYASRSTRGHAVRVRSGTARVVPETSTRSGAPATG